MAKSKTAKQSLDLVRCFDEQSGQPLIEIMLSPWGSVASTSGDFVVNDEGSAAVVADFQARKLPLPIDYEHTTEGANFSTPSGAAPAAGWIEAIVPKPGFGLMAMVKWNDAARSMILNDEYRYLSPVVLVDKETRVCVAVRSAALTNTPAIRDMARVAAKETMDMDTTKLESEIKSAADVLRKTLTEAGLTLADNLGLTELVKAAQEFAANVTKAKADAANAPSPTAAIASKLGLDAKANVEAIVAKVGELVTKRVPAEELDKVVAKLNELEAKEVAREAERLIAKAIDDGKLNPNDKDLMAWASDLAKTPAEFIKWEKVAAKVVPTGKIVSSDKGDSPKSERDAVIAKALTDYDADPKATMNAKRHSWVNVALKEAGHDVLSKKETEALVG